MSGYPIIFGEGVDPDAYQYFLRAGIASGTQTPSSYDNAATFNGTNQFLSVASNSTLTVTGTSFTYAFWANAVNTTPLQLIVVKQDAPGNLREYQMFFVNGNIQFDVFPDGNFSSRKAVGQIAGPVNSWNFYVCRYDSSGGGTIGISINGSAFNSVGSIGAITQTHSNPLQIGANPGPNNFFSGALASVGFWKRALTASEVTALFNNGAGRTYASLDTGLRTNLISWWALNQNSVTADSHTTGNNLTNNGTPLVTATTLGPIVTTTQNSRQLINNFVKGIKSLGLWNSLVCWPLRRSQNASTTLTVRSLGGLGTFDGAIAGGLTAANWSPDGFVFNVNNGAINFSTLDFGSSTFIHLTKKSWLTLPSHTDFEMNFQRFVSIPALKSRKYIMMGAPNSGSTQLNEFGASLVDYSSGSFGYSGQVSNNSFLQNQFMLAASQANGNLYSQYRNGIALQSNVTGARNFDTPAGGSDYTTAGGVSNVLAAIASGGVGHNVTSALMCLFNTQLNAVQHSNVNALIKSTVGSGLY
jgi:hypothetical protein